MTKSDNDREQAVGPFLKALSRTHVRHTPFHVETDYSCDCTNPPTVQSFGRSYERPGGKRVSQLQTTMQVRCRKCPNCLMANARHWAARGCAEAEKWEPARVWAVTLTSRLEYHNEKISRIKGYWEADDEERVKLLARAEGEDLTKAFKKVRHWWPPFSYLLVCEAHESGMPHFHMLIHERFANTIKKRDIVGDPDEGIPSRFWPHGEILHARLCAPENLRNAVWYACKYLSKSPLSRVRSSQRYGVST